MINEVVLSSLLSSFFSWVSSIVLKVMPNFFKKFWLSWMRKKYVIDIEKIKTKDFRRIFLRLLKDKDAWQYISFTSRYWRTIISSDDPALTLSKETFCNNNKCLRYALRFLFNSSYKGILCRMFKIEELCRMLEMTIRKFSGLHDEKMENCINVALWINSPNYPSIEFKFDVEQRSDEEKIKLVKGDADLSWLTNEELICSFYPKLLFYVGNSLLRKKSIPLESADYVLCYSNWNIGLG